MASKRARTDLDAFATKRDLGELRTELRNDMGELRTELRNDMGELRTELRNDMTELRSEMRAQAVHFENVVVTQIRALTEVVQSNDERTQRQLQELEARLGARISLLEDAVRTLSADLRDLRREVADLRRAFNTRPEPDELRALEVRVTALEIAVKRTPKQG